MPPKANGSEGEHTGIQSYVAHIQWQAKEVSNLRREAHEIAKRDAGAPGGYVVVKPVGNVLHSLHTDLLAERVLRNGSRNTVINCEVFAPSSDKRCEPEEDAGEGSVDDGARFQRVQRSIDL